MARKQLLLFLGLIPIVLLSACGFQKLQQGEPNFNTAILLPQTASTSPAAGARDAAKLGLTPDKLPGECEASTGGATGKALVETCVYAVKAVIDDHYREYRITLHHYADNGNAAADLGVLGLTTAATAPISAVAKTILSGMGTFIGGGKSIINEDLLYKQAIEVVINQMDADRAQQFTIMLKELSGDNYSLQMAKDDLLLYYAAGTWDHAMTSLQSKVAASAANCRAQTNTAKVNKATTGSASGTPTAADTPAVTDTSAPECPQPPSPGQTGSLSPTSVKAGETYGAVRGPAAYQVVKPAAVATDTIELRVAPDGKTFAGNTILLPFTVFAAIVNPTPVAKPSPSH